MIEEAIDEIIQRIDPKYPNLWILDPYAATALPWDRISKISNHIGRYEVFGKKHERRPELIISFMTADLQRNVNSNPHIISDTLGMDEEEWRPSLNQLIDQGYNLTTAIVFLFGKQLAKFFGKDPLYVRIDMTNGPRAVYYIFFCTRNDPAYYMMRIKGMKNYKDWYTSEWDLEASRINNQDEQKILFDF